MLGVLADPTLTFLLKSLFDYDQGPEYHIAGGGRSMGCSPNVIMHHQTSEARSAEGTLQMTLWELQNSRCLLDK